MKDLAGMGAQLRAIMGIDPDAIAIEQNGQTFGWGALARSIEQVDAKLKEAGVDEQARVGVLIRNRTSHVAALLAILASRRTLVVLNPIIASERLEADVGSLALAAIIGDAEDLDRPEVLRASGTSGSAVIALSPGLNDVSLRVPASIRLLPGKGDVAVEMLTSGTTGIPKRVALSRRDFEAALRGALVYEKGRGDGAAPVLCSGVSLHNAPLSHISGMFGMLNTLLAGRRLVLFERFDVQAWRDAVVRHRPRVASLVPAALRMVLDANVPREDLASLSALRTGTAPLPPETALEFLDRYDLPVLQNYGATEFIGGLSGWTLADFHQYFKNKPRSCGRIHEGVDARVLDPHTGAVLPVGAQGVLEVRAGQINGGTQWYRTTDLAIIDADNFLTICGRTDQAIIRGGFKIHPEEVVAALLRHPAVREAVVVGVPNQRLGAVPAAAIILRDGHHVGEGEIVAFLRDHLSAYQVPARYLFVNDVPRTPALKPALPAVTALFSADMSVKEAPS